MTKKLSFLSYGLYYKVYIHGQFCFSQYLMFLKVFLKIYLKWYAMFTNLYSQLNIFF